MVDPKKTKGATCLWKWQDQDIENPRMAKSHLEAIHQLGFSGILAAVGDSRYAFLDRQVIRTIAQTSQWARKRSMAYWFDCDPRKASRAFIVPSDERIQTILISRRSPDRSHRQSPNIARIRDGAFRLRFSFPHHVRTDALQEGVLLLEPWSLEKVFCFQMSGRTVLKNTALDITSESRIHWDMVRGEVEVFGEIRIPPGQTWWMTAFPKVNTNHYDYSGLESSERLRLYIEEIFDACANLNGVTWGLEETGYATCGVGYPVSLSLFNSFRSEYQYDLRNVLYGLVLDVDDGSHVRIRCDYFSLLMKTLYSALHDFHRMIHSFFGGIQTGLHHSWSYGARQTDGIVEGHIDPWQSLASVQVVFNQMKDDSARPGLSANLDSIVSMLVLSKSLGVHADLQKAFLRIPPSFCVPRLLGFLADLFGLFSVEWLYEMEGEITAESGIALGKGNPDPMRDVNIRLDRIRGITGFRFPEATGALVFPVETLMNAGPAGAGPRMRLFDTWIRNMVRSNIAFDVISPSLLKKGKLSAEGVRIQNRVYEFVVFLDPEILDSEVLEVISLMEKFRLPILLGGRPPGHTTKGKRIPHILPMVFDPSDSRLESLNRHGIKPILSVPPHALGTTILKGEDRLILIAPDRPNHPIGGPAQCMDTRFSIPSTRTLVIFRMQKSGNIERLL